METFLQDLRFALRTLWKNRTFTLIAVACLSLAIGANATMFSIVNAAFLKPFPARDHASVMGLYETQPKAGTGRSGVAYLNFRDWREQTRSFAELAISDQRSITIGGGEEPERLEGGGVSWNLFPMLGVQPILGSGFREEEDRPGGPQVVLLSYEVWQRHFGGDRSIVGQSINVNDVPHTIVGVMPPRFAFPARVTIWVPVVPLIHDDRRNEKDNLVVGRLKPGVSVAQAQADLSAVSARLTQQYPVDNEGWQPLVLPLKESFIGQDERVIIFAAMGAVCFVLLIACANVANLLLARATVRSREIAIRAALGAGRRRIVRQLLTESAIIGVLGALIGIPFAMLGLHLIDTTFPAENQPAYWLDWSISTRELLYMLGISLVAALLFGLAPALQAVQANLQEALREGGRGSSAGGRRGRLRSVLVVGEVALSLILLVSASLFVRSFANLERTQGGFDSHPLMTMRFYLPGPRYDSIGARARRVEDIVRRVEALPGVQAATVSNEIAIDGGGGESTVLVEGRPAARGEEPRIFYSGVTAHWFRTLGVRVIKGRDLTDAEGADSSPVAVINQTLAARLWKGEDPLGKRFRFANDSLAPWIAVVGVIPDIKDQDLNEKNDQGSAYLPYRFLVPRNNGLTIRTGGDPASVTTAVRGEIRASDPALPVFHIRTMEEVRRLSYWQYKLFGWMFSIFGGLALLLAAAGVYGVLSYSVSQRRQEIGVRVALGAQRADVLRLVVRQGLQLALAGIALGALGALGMTRVISSLLFGVTATDPVSFVGVGVFLGATALVASYLPARRATSVDPVVALQE